MRVGVTKEVKSHEYRLGLVPAAIHEFWHPGHQTLVESGAGLGIGFCDVDYRSAGAKIAPDARAVFETADLVVKVKEPQPSEIALLRPTHVLFTYLHTYLHLAADKAQAEALMASGATCIAYETVSDEQGGRLSSTFPSTRAGVSRQVDLRPMPIRPTRSTASSIIA